MDLEEIMDPTTTTGRITSIVSALVLLGLYLLWRAIKPRLDRVLGQTENSHEKTEYPNLRDEVTAIRTLVEQTAVTSAETAQTRSEEHTTELSNQCATSKSSSACKKKKKHNPNQY